MRTVDGQYRVSTAAPSDNALRVPQQKSFRVRMMEKRISERQMESPIALLKSNGLVLLSLHHGVVGATANCISKHSVTVSSMVKRLQKSKTRPTMRHVKYPVLPSGWVLLWLDLDRRNAESR